MMIQAVLGNPHHPEYGVATIPFPIPHDQYARCMELLEALEIGDVVKADCKVQAIDSFYTVLKRTEMLTVNVEELNYLAKRLDGFDIGEAAQFQAMAHKLELFELKDLINLTFCCQQATVITDFSDLAAVGREHYMNLHGGSARIDELEALDGEKTARQLIGSGSGTVTPYGVVYDNGMKLGQVYDGRCFPCYYYEPKPITVALTSKIEPEDTEHITWLYLPMVQEEIGRVLQRAGITDTENVHLRLEDADGNLIRLTCDDFACAAEFRRWKDWSDSDLRKEENADHQQADNAISMEVLSEEATAVASIEDEYMELISADEGATLVRLLGQGLSSHLTETQRRRLWKYCVEGKSVRLIAKEECAYRNAVWKSIQAAKEKMFNFFVETGCAKPRFRRDR